MGLHVIDTVKAAIFLAKFIIHSEAVWYIVARWGWNDSLKHTYAAAHTSYTKHSDYNVWIGTI